MWKTMGECWHDYGQLRDDQGKTRGILLRELWELMR
jgi:hypothetical protein